MEQEKEIIKRLSNWEYKNGFKNENDKVLLEIGFREGFMQKNEIKNKKFVVEIDQKAVTTEIQFINIGNLRELFFQRGSINEEDKWEFYLITSNKQPDVLVHSKFILDLNTSPYPRFYSVDTTPMSGG